MYASYIEQKPERSSQTNFILVSPKELKNSINVNIFVHHLKFSIVKRTCERVLALRLKRHTSQWRFVIELSQDA